MLEIDKIHLGDCYNLIKEIDSNSVDLIIIDPPYLYKEKSHLTEKRISKNILKLNNELLNNNLTQGIDMSLLPELIRVMKKINIYIWCNKKQIQSYLDFFVGKHKCKFELLIWHKSNAMPIYSNHYLVDCEYCLYFKKGGYCQPKSYEEARTIFEHTINVEDKKHFYHPTIKPLGIIKTLIKNSSKENDLILDCFIGSGTTAVASKILNRHFLGIENNPKWYKISCDRLEKRDANGQSSFLLY